MSSEDIQELKSEVDIVEVIGKFIDLKKKGRNYIGKCIFHNDSNPSLTVNPKKQTFKCYSCMEKQEDVVTFLTMCGETFKDALEILKGEREANPVITPKIDIPLSEWEAIPAEEETPTFKHHIFPEFDYKWCYISNDNKVSGYIVRKNIKDGKKAILPYTYAVCTKEGYEDTSKDRTKGVGKFSKVGEKQWRWMSMPFQNRPLYNLPLLNAFPNAKVLIVEGEKTADNLQSRFNPEEYIVVTWSGGTNATQMSDFTLLIGRNPIFLPDLDYTHTDKHNIRRTFFEQPSQKAMLTIAKVLGLEQMSIVFPKNYEDYFCGYDQADNDWNGEETLKFINDSLLKIKI